LNKEFGNSKLLLYTIKKLTIPRLFPKRAVFCELKEAIAPMQHRDDPNAAKLCISGKLFITPHV